MKSTRSCYLLWLGWGTVGGGGAEQVVVVHSGGTDCVHPERHKRGRVEWMEHAKDDFDVNDYSEEDEKEQLRKTKVDGVMVSWNNLRYKCPESG
ncbi:hypothetical protein HN51_048823 [Arachis hypogaea]